MDRNYWTSRPQRRLRRRAFLSGAAATGLGVAALPVVGCGDDDDTSGSNATAPSGGSSPGASTTATANTEQPKKGGTWQAYGNFSPPNFDPNEQNFMTVAARNYVYSQLFRRNSGPGVDTSEFVTDAAQALPEITDGGLKYIVKLRPDVKFHAPISRALDAQDVVYSYQRNTGAVQGTPAAAVSGDLTSIVDKVEATDNQTVVFTVKRPYVPFLARLGDPNMLSLLPKEFADAVNPAQNMIGSGPWLFDGHVPGSVVKYKRNPAWHLGPDVPYTDAANINIVPEYATQLSQFLGGNLDELTPQGGDISRIRDTLKGASFSSKVFAAGSYMFFSTKAGSPWRDPKVRQAISIAINRDDLQDAAYDLTGLEKSGIKFDRVWNSFIPAGWGKAWVDPHDARTKDAYEYNPDKAKQLLEQAGFKDGFEAQFPYSTGYGAPYNTATELIIQFLGRIGIKLTGVPQDQATEFLPKTYRAHGEFDGFAWTLETLLADPGDYLEQLFTPGFLRNKSGVDDPDIAAKAAKIQSDFDANSRLKEIQDLQVELVKTMYYIPMPAGGQPTVIAFSPRARNGVEYRPWQDTYNGTTSRPWYWLAS